MGVKRVSLAFILTIVAIVLAVGSLIATLASDEFEPLSGFSVEVLGEDLEPGETVEVHFTACSDQDVTLMIFTFWNSPPATAHLGPSAATEFEEGCTDTKVEVEVPQLSEGLWQLSLVAMGAADGRTQAVSVTSNAVEVVP